MKSSKIKELISEIIKEMAFKGVKKPVVDGRDTVLSALGYEINQDKELDFDKTKKQTSNYFKSPLFARQATKFYGDRNFPDSNTWVAPYIGGEHSAYVDIILGDKNIQDTNDVNQYNVPGINPREELKGGLGDRMMTYPLSPGIVKRLGLSGEGVDLNKDIIFVPIATALHANFLPSVHMIFHAMFDQGGLEKGMPIMSDVISDLKSLALKYYYYFTDDRPAPPSIKAGTTKSLRSTPFSPNDFVAEVLTGAILYKGGIDNLPFDSKLIEKIKAAVKEFKNHIKGKVVMVTVA